ncbi:MAG TPA: hypothetical protein VN811_03895 [Thermoanaerobaculia bacterium]|nr:hypothetical protein [Thermoanaerobaculia bacterium]
MVVAVAALCSGCASGAGGRVVSSPQVGASAAAGAPWDLPPGAVPSQRLYQGAYEGPEGGGAFRATLRLAASDRFRLDASDRLGRPLWTVGVDGEDAWWIDHRAGVWCPDLSRLALPGLGRGPVPATALPAMLLGVLPARPASETTTTADGAVEVTDAAGRRWQATVDAGHVTAWSVAEGGQPLWWWRRQGRGGILSQRSGRQLRWQEAVVEPLKGALPPRSVPADYREACDELPER